MLCDIKLLLTRSSCIILVYATAVLGNKQFEAHMRKTCWDEEAWMDLITDWLSFSRERRGEGTSSMETRVSLMSNVSLPGGTSNRRVCTFFEELRACSLPDLPFLLPNQNMAVNRFGWTGLSVLPRELLCATIAVQVLNYLNSPSIEMKRKFMKLDNEFVCVF